MAKSTNFVDKQVGFKARMLRDGAGVSSIEAAKLVGVSLDDYSKLEAGELRFKAKQLMTLAARFAVPASTFLEEVRFPYSAVSGAFGSEARSSVH